MPGGRQLTAPTPARAGSDATTRRRAAGRCRRKFLEYFPDVFRDTEYIDTERSYKWEAHLRWRAELGTVERADRLTDHECVAVARQAIRIEASTNLLFSFEKMAIRDAVGEPDGARTFVVGLMDRLYGPGTDQARFERWRDALDALPRRQTRVATWPVATVFAFIAEPRKHMFLKPNVTRHAAHAYDFPFEYHTRLRWETYASLLDFAKTVQRDVRDLRPRDMIDVQSFIWVQGSDEYE